MASKILIADDETNLVLSLEYLMQRQGYAVSVARDGNQAMKMIRQQHPDLIMLDVILPGQSGFEICQQVRADPGLHNTRIVLLTAKARETDIAKGKALGADAYIVKPFCTTALLKQIRDLLGEQR